MNFNSIVKVFVPSDTSFFPLFEEDAKILIHAAELLKQLMASEPSENRESLVKQIKAVELEGDEVTHKIYDQLNKSFITPFDREDIQELASRLDDVVDFINGSSQRVNLYKPKSFIHIFPEMAETIYLAAVEIETSLHGLKNAVKNRERIIQSCINLNTIENKGDDLYHQGISELFEGEADAKELIKKKEILETLEKCIDKAEDVSDVIKTILIKLA